MSRQDYTAADGPSWVDVQKCIEHIEGTFNGKITVLLELHEKKSEPRYWHVHCAFRSWENYPNGVMRAAIGRRWDRHGFKSITAQLYNMLLSIDNRLTTQEEEALRQSAF